MTEKTIEFPLTPENIKPEGGNSRRNSTGKTSTLNSCEKILPHYLRASIGSCHDVCKYGNKHAFETKERFPKRKGIIATSSEDQVLADNGTLAHRQKKSVIQPKPSQKSKTHLLDTPKIIKRDGSSSAKKVDFSAKQVPLPTKKTDPSATSASALKLKPKAIKPSSSSMIPLGISSGRRDNDIKIGENYGTSKTGKKKGLVPPTASLPPQPVKNVARKHKNLKSMSPLKNQSKGDKDGPKQLSDDKVGEKTLYIVEPKSENRSLEFAQNGSCTNRMNRSLSSSSLSSSASMSPSTSLSLSLQKEESHVTSKSTHREANASLARNAVTKSKNQKITSKAENKRWSGRDAIVFPNGKDCPTKKLNFRGGKVVNLQSENKSPRRLRFRQGRMLGENQNGKADGRRSFRRRKELGVCESSGSKAESEKVVLRHQDVQGKKDAQGLFNNVIEQTACKLAKTRKSKVKALVGAFETVISLQENKTNATITR